MHYVVVGCGRVGSSLARQLVDLGHTVAVIDRREAAFDRLGPDFPGQTFVGVGFDRELLKEAGIEHAEAVASVTSGDNSNILIARVARETFGIERVVARIYDPRRAAIYQRLGIPTVATVAWTTDRVLRKMLPEDPSVVWIDESTRVLLAEREVPSSWAGHPVTELEAASSSRVAALSRFGVGQLADAAMLLQEGDVVYATVPADGLERLDQALSAAPRGGH